MTNFLKKLIFVIALASIIFQPYIDIINKAIAAEDIFDSMPAGVNPDEYNTNYDEAEQEGQIGGIDDDIAAAAESLEKFAFDNSGTLTKITDDPLSISMSAMDLIDKNKLIFNPSDEQDIRTLYCLGNVIPDFANDLEALALELGRDYADITRIKLEDPEAFNALVKDAQRSAKSRITSNLRNDVTNFACIAGVDEIRASEMLANDPESVDEIIRYASEDIVIDRRILELLVNLVTPKNQGGAGHERIKVYRIRRNYNREALQYSRESDAIREQILGQNRSESERDNPTIEEVSTMEDPEIVSDPVFDQAEALGATTGDSNNRDQGELIFSDQESNLNISAHAKGQAVDISEVDNIKCTLIKKRRLGSDTKIKRPPTPIKLLWQTNEGYSRDEQMINDGINSQIRSMMTGEMIDLLDEFGISIDDETDLSDANLSDILQMIGSSLISEVLNSPSNSLEGFDFGDTIKKIGALLIADRLDLPRSAFWGSDFDDINELEASIGEAVFEKNLNLPYWSVRGQNLSEVLTNIGIRKIETELHLPVGSLNAQQTSQREIRLSAGRSLIESKLHLRRGTFQSDTNFRRLREVAGERKIDLIFANPSVVDERLDLEIGTSQNYVRGSISADEYANLVGAKLLADNAFIHQFMLANTNAINATAVSADSDRTQNTQILSSILSGDNNSDGFITNYQQIGIHTLAKAINNNEQIQQAIINWLTHNVGNQNCQIEAEIYGSVELEGRSIRVAIPEDEFMASAGVRRGDLSRLFGCENVVVSSVFRRTGEKALINAIINSDIASQMKRSFLADHPEIQEIIADIEFYRTRIENIRELAERIRTETNALPDDLPGREEVIQSIGRILTRTEAIDTGNLDTSVIRNYVREIGNESDVVYRSANVMIQEINQEIIARLNRIIADSYEIIHNLDEIFAGEEQPRVRSLTIDQIESINQTNLPNNGERTRSSNINIGVLSMVLASRLAPNELFYSLGSGQVEEALDLPANSILYFVKHVTRDDRDRNRDKNLFFQSIGQAMIEESFNMPSFFFQGENPGDDSSLIEIRNHIAESYDISQAEAGARIMRAFGLSGSFNSPASSPDFNNRTAEIDRRLSIRPGTTKKFFLDQLIIVPGAISNLDYQLVSAILGISEYSLKRFTAIKNGRESLDDVNSTNALTNIYYSSHNPFSRQPTTTPGTCPITYSLRDGVSVADGVINNNSYNYVDRNGQHSFPSLDQARAYAAQNEADRITFLDEIARALSARLREAGSTITQEEMERRLSEFLRDPLAENLFSNEELAQINSGNIDSPDANPEYIPSDVSRNMFSRTINHNTASDYKQTVGEATAEKRIVRTIFSSLNIDVVGLRIDAGDIFDILSGNGTEVLYRIGGRYLERQLDIPAETLTAIIEADSKDLRSCTIQQIGGHILGSLIDLPNLSLEGNIYDNIGSAAIERALNLPPYSFRGNTLDELINNVGPINFAAAFNLPFTRFLSPTTIRVILNNETSQSEFERMTLTKQITKVKQAVEHPESVGIDNNELGNLISETKAKIGEEVKKLAENESLWEYSNNPHTMSDLDKNRIIQAVNRVDSELGIPPGTTKRFLTAEITPNQFRQQVSETEILTLAGAEIAQLFDGDMEQGEARSMVRSIVAGIRSRDSNDWKNVGLIAAGFLGRKLDAKLGVEPGTIARLIADPSQASAVAMEVGLRKLDESLNINPQSRLSFSWLYRVYDDFANGNTSEYQQCRLDTEFCFTRIVEPGSTSRQSIQGFANFLQNNWLALTTEMSAEIIGRYIREQKIPIDSNDYDLAARDLIGFIQGDMSFLEIAGTVAVASSVNSMGEEANDLPEVFRITYADIHYAIRGDARYQARYALRAEQSMVSAAIAGENYSTRPPDLGIFSLISGIENRLGITPPQTAAPPPGDYTGFEYDTQLHQEHREEQFEAENPIALEVVPVAYDETDDTYEQNRDEVFGNPETFEIIRDSREQAAARQRNEALQNLSFRLSDGQLWRLDPAIPPGFTEIMMTGSSRQRTEMIYQYIRNGLSRGKIAGIELPEWTQGIDLIGLTSFIQNPNVENLAGLASSGSLERIDGLLSEQFSNLFGFQLQPGTISAIFAGAVTGDFVNNQNIGGVTIRSVAQIYSDWATQKLTAFTDKFFNLPPGTSFQILSMYRSLSAARAAAASASFAISNAEASIEAAVHAGNAAAEASARAELAASQEKLSQAKGQITAIKAEVISFIITTVFSKEITKAEQAIGLVPGTGGLLVGMAVSYLMGAAINPAVIAIFVLQNLFGVYKQVLVCTADGYYPGIEQLPDPTIVDVAGLGTFNGLSQKQVKENYIKAAQYKARTLAGDALMLAERTGDELAIPSQIMVGRQEDVDYWAYKTDEVICSKIGGCLGTRAGMWKNPQTTFYTHIGF